MSTYRLARNSAAGGFHVALNAVLLPAEAPEWVELIPTGPQVVGRDGRAWTFDQPELLLHAFLVDAVDLPVDWEHASETRARQGLDAPAAGWIKALEIRSGALWGRVEWTPRGAEAVQGREYRYLSPVFQHELASGRIVRLVSAGLTNQPNLHLTSLNQKEPETVNPLHLKLIALLGLPQDTTEEALLAHMGTLKAGTPEAAKVQEIQAQADTVKAENETLKAENARLQAAQPSITTYVPRADYDALMARVATAENRLQKAETDKLEDSITTAVNAAIKDGKVTPASRDYYLAQCRKAGGLDEFKAFCQAAPMIAPDNAANSSKADTSAALPESQLALCRQMGVKPEDFAKNLPTK